MKNDSIFPEKRGAYKRVGEGRHIRVGTTPCLQRGRTFSETSFSPEYPPLLTRQWRSKARKMFHPHSRYRGLPVRRHSRKSDSTCRSRGMSGMPWGSSCALMGLCTSDLRPSDDGEARRVARLDGGARHEREALDQT